MKTTHFFNGKKLATLIGIIALILLLCSSWWRTRCVQMITYPLLLAEHKLGTPIKQWWAHRKGFGQLQTVAERAIAERDALLRQIIELRSTRDYRLDCTECLEFKKRYESKNSLVVQVLLKQLSENGHYFFIDAGENRGIKKDMVVVYDNSLVGRITEVYPHYSKVLLVTDATCHVAARCLETGARGIQSGLLDSKKMGMEFVNHLDKLHVGDTVVSQGEGLVFPRGFALGKIKKYQLNGMQYDVEIEPLIDLNSIDFCLVLLTH